MFWRMKKELVNIFSVLILAAGCQVSDIDPETGGISGRDDGYIDASCYFSGLAGENAPGLSAGTKAPVGQTTTVALSANFLKWDEPYQSDVTPETYIPVGEDVTVDWSKAVIVDATVSSPQNNSINFRSINMDPRQTYRTFGSGESKVGYISRMVGWYPATYDVPDDYTGEGTSNAIYENADGYVKVGNDFYVLFKNKLDLKTDVMMTDIREGRIKLKGFKNNGSDREIQPFGHEYSDPLDYNSKLLYNNYFTFKHYLSAIRLFVNAEDSELSLISWGQINNVVFDGQPSTVKIRLPKSMSGSGNLYGEAVEWSDEKDMDIVKEPMFDGDPEYGIVPDYPVTLENAISMRDNYLGYALVRPGVTVPVELHTDAGIFSVEIDPSKLTAGDGLKALDNGFEPGYIYNIYIDIKTNGSIDVVLGNSDLMHFENLAPYNDNLKNFEYSNCYVIDLGDLNNKSAESTGTVKGGFYFYAGVPGRGEAGLVPGQYPESDELDPYSVQILWQSQEYLIRHAELLHGYVRFILNDACYNADDPLDGNAVLAVSDRSGDIIWSWHIWVVKGLEDVEINTGGSTSVTMHNMNLGATKAAWSSASSASDVLETYGLYYQWGRKDPSPGPASYDYGLMDMITAPYVTNAGVQTSVQEGMYSQPTVEDGARHPLVVISSTSTDDYPNDWLYYKVDNLWGYEPSSGKVEKKTVYDPCPYGYRVADDELRTVFEYYKNNDPEPDKIKEDYETQIASSGYGWEKVGSGYGHVYNGAYFPFAGWKGHDQGRTDRTHAWFGVGTHGDYQSARIKGGSSNDYNANHRERNLILKNSLFTYKEDSRWEWFQRVNYYISKSYTVLNVSPSYSTNITLDWANRTTAAPVRCVKYDGADEEPDSEK